MKVRHAMGTAAMNATRATKRRSGFAVVATSIVLPLVAACGPEPFARGYVDVASGGGDQPTCTDWNDYDDEWHRCHWDEPAIVWCNAPDAGPVYVPRADAGAGAVASSDSGRSNAGNSDGASSGTVESGASSTDGATPSSDSGAMSSVESGNTGVAADGGSSVQGGPAAPCTVSATCAPGTSCVMGSCLACPGGICSCQRDDDCPANQICDHTSGSCAQPPPACSALTTEAACVARANCIPLYGGMNCTNNLGNACHSGEANCTCATYSFAACIARGP